MIRRSLTFRLVFWYCSLLLVLGAGFSVYTVMGFTRYADATTRRTLAGRAEEVWRLAEPHLGDRAALAAAIESRFEPEDQSRFIRLSVGGVVLYASGPPAEADFDPGQIPPPRPGVAGRMIHEAGANVVAQDFALPDGTVAIVESGRPDAILREMRRGLETSLIVALPLLLGIAGAGGWMLVRQALAPVSNMVVAAEALSFNSPEKRLPLRGTLEPIGLLGQSLNRMLDRLESAYQHVSQFSADTAHELRTPLTIIQGELELIQAAAELPEHFRAALAAVLQETTRLGRIVESLITLSRMGSFWGKQVHLPVDLRAVTAETVEQMHLLAEDKDVVLECAAGDAVTIMADRNRLKQVLVNLIDNAVKFTQPGGRITVSLTSSATTATLIVADTGIGISAEHHARIFDRSYRIGGGGGGGELGAGLGLAIAKSICAAHGGKIDVTSSPGHGATFRVELPRGLDGQSPRLRSSDAIRVAAGS